MARILVVDDSTVNREVVMAMLREAGYEVEGAGAQDEALEMAGQGFDLFLIDIMLRRKLSDVPDSDTAGGVKVVKQLREHEATRNIPVVAMTKRGDRPWVEKMLSPYHIQGYFELVPISEPTALAEIRRALVAAE